MKLVSTPMHGIRWHEEPVRGGLCWWQYWRGIQHVWYWRGIPVWRRLRKRDRPMYELIRQISGA